MTKNSADEMVDVEVRLEPRDDGFWVVMLCEDKEACAEVGPITARADAEALFKATVNQEQSVTIGGKEYPLRTH
jgi:hypothetical protein